MLHRMPLSARPLFVFSLACSSAALAVGPGAPPPAWTAAAPILAESCYDCHNSKKSKGGVDLARLEKDPAVGAEYALWEKVQEVIANGSMPPEDETQLSPAEKQQLLGWVKGALDAVALANAGDPGPVTLRRLTNAEYDYTIRDLTGQDYGVAREFQPDGGGGEGFANTGDTLFVNPSQLDKYLAAARKLADHATLLPGTGVVFHPQRVGLRGREQVKGQAQQALYVWYQKMSAPHLPKDGDDFREADYMLACWKWKHKDATGAESLDKLADEAGLSRAFLANWWKMLHDDKLQSRFLDLTRQPWHALPGPDAAKPKETPAAVLAGVKAIQVQRRSWDNPQKPGSGVQRRQQDSDGLRSYPARVAVEKGAREVKLVVGDLGDGNGGDLVQFTGLTIRRDGKVVDYARAMRQVVEAKQKVLQELAAGKSVPAGMTAEGLQKEIQAVEKVLGLYGKDPLGKGGVKPEFFAVKAPAVISIPLPQGVTEVNVTGRLDMRAPDVDLATVQWTLAAGTAPDPQKIIPGVLTVWKRQTEAARRTMGDFGRMKSAFPDVFERRLEEVAANLYRRTPGPGVYYFSDEQLGSLLDDKERRHWQAMKVDWGLVAPDRLSKEQLADYDTRMRQHLHAFASQAWRRPATEPERAMLSKLYQEGVTKGLDRESAAREAVVLMLVSPHFLYKTEPGALAATPAPGVEGAAPAEVPLTAWEVASRLSYFLWSSQPDWSLRKAASDGSLLKPEVLAAQVKRMMKDPKAEALAREFAGQWLEFKGFDKHAAVDAKKYPEFTPELRADMDRETTLFFTHLIREDRPVWEVLGADYTFLNERLARHYGVPGVKGEEFVKTVALQQHRGGLLGQGSLLTKTSRSHRTSPVLRGNWLLQAVLGTPVPPPPSDVPELKEHGPKPATVREMLEQHRAAKACSSCHDRIDPLGFALENYDPVGRFRDKDEQGLPLDTSGQVKGSPAFTGFEGLRAYLKSQEAQFTRHFCRKLTGYALGRQVLPTDKLLLQEMQSALAKNEGHFSAAVLAVVNSRQFLNKRP